MFLAQTEPPPSGWNTAGEYLVDHAEKRPDVIFPLLAIVGLLGLIAGVLYVFVKFGLPRIDAWVMAWREEKQRDREHLSNEIARRGKEAQEDLAAARELHKSQHDSIVENISTRIDRITGEFSKLTDRFEKQHETVTKIAMKIGATILALVLILSSGFAFGVVQGLWSLKAGECPKGCPTEQKCCGINKCCPDKRGKQASVEPHSALGWNTMLTLASDHCFSANDICGRD